MRRAGKIVGMKSQYIGSCVSNPFDDPETLENVIDSGTEITRDEFLASCHVPEDVVESMMEYPHSYDYCRSEYEGPEFLGYLSPGTVYFFTESAIEHFFA